MRPIIEFCCNNTFHGTEELMRKLEQNPDFDVVEYGCLGNCGECFTLPYALVNGIIVTGETPEALYEAIMKAVEEYEQSFDF